ncbi:MAG: bifunctional proline dehydrogenase/L-glutamate gamma-semialdehyde dehydrogenase PutA [Pseudomonadota bacterium]
MVSLAEHRSRIRAAHRLDEATLLQQLITAWGPSESERQSTVARAKSLVETIRSDDQPGLMEQFLVDYGLSSEEGLALMCLAEALLRVPDAQTQDALIEDKISPSNWDEHLGDSSSSLVNASTWLLTLTKGVLSTDESAGLVKILRQITKRLGQPVIRTAVNQAMKILGEQFVLGETISEALQKGQKQQAAGYRYSYDMLGEAAITEVDAKGYFESYHRAIETISGQVVGDDLHNNPGISIKLSALHPRYDALQSERVMTELIPRVLTLVQLAKRNGVGLNIDAEEANRLDLSLDVIEALLRHPSVKGWDGFGIVVQAYGKRASFVIDWINALATELDQTVMVRLVKGAYWDTEIKLAQVDGVNGFPVFTAKSATDVCYICCARQLLSMNDRIYPQFATHNAHTMAAILESVSSEHAYEFQRLHGMGEALHRTIKQAEGTNCRIYAPVGQHRDLLAYLVRRLLENGANSSFVNQLMDERVPVETIIADPFARHVGQSESRIGNDAIKRPADLFQPTRQNSKGWDLRDTVDLAAFEKAREPFADHQWQGGPITARKVKSAKPVAVINPANPIDEVGQVSLATTENVAQAMGHAKPWTATAEIRAETLNRAADLFEVNAGEVFALLAREAGKTPLDAIGELREAVDFLRFYASEALRLKAGEPAGIVVCISPWNFPLAIFAGQIAAALAAGNGVIAKPAEPTPLIACRAVEWLLEAGVPKSALQCLPGEGGTVGAAMTSHPGISGVCFTGSTNTAQRINRAMADNLQPDAFLIAETGGLNAMVVDSTALPEAAVQDIVTSAFQSAGQRCSAVRIVYLQSDIAEPFLHMLSEAMDELALGNPWHVQTDVGPIITGPARQDIQDYLDEAVRDGRLIKQMPSQKKGHFFGPTLIRVKGIADMGREIFGPVLHVATFDAEDLDGVIEAINAQGYGLTFGLHTRLDTRVEKIAHQVRAGNIYVNRNQIGAVVQSQPFGGEGLSGTGPKAGGPHYVARFQKQSSQSITRDQSATRVSLDNVQDAIDALPKLSETIISEQIMPGPTGELNRLVQVPRGVILCLGPTAKTAQQQAEQVQSVGCQTLQVAMGAQGEGILDGYLDPADLESLTGFDAVVFWGEDADQRAMQQALAARSGPLIPLITQADIGEACLLERHLCVDTTAAGGNTALMSMEF